MEGSNARTEIIYGTPNIIKGTLQRLSAAVNKIDVCISSAAVEGTVKAEPIFKETLRLKEIGIKIRYISEITKQNLPYCKSLMLTAEFRHIDGIKGNFSIVDGRDYQDTAAVNEGDPPSESVLSTARAFVDQQQFIFDMLWHKAIPAKQRIKEIEQGLKREFIETIQDPYETQKTFSGILKSANEEILISFPTKATVKSDAVYRYVHEYLLPLLRNVASRGVEIWLLDGQSTDENQDMKSLIAKNNSDVVKIHVLKSHHQNKIITAIVDKELCLTVEVRDTSDYEDENDASIEVLGLATYSNSESTILSYASIFETLWIQAELRSKTKKNI